MFSFGQLHKDFDGFLGMEEALAAGAICGLAWLHCGHLRIIHIYIYIYILRERER